MNILLTNDDGIYAEGLFYLQREIRKIANITIVAPDRERSSVSHGITLAHPLWFKRISRQNKPYGFAVSGTPADCVKIAVGVIMKKKPDLIISGINWGSNDGCSVFYSGTVAGAREGALMGIPAMAVSLATFTNPDFGYSAQVAARLAQLMNRNKMPLGTFLNVNVPNIAKNKIKGIRITRQGTEPIQGKFSKRFDPSSREYFWLTAEMPLLTKDLANDTYALSKNYVTVTPILCDLTNQEMLGPLAEWSI